MKCCALILVMLALAIPNSMHGAFLSCFKKPIDIDQDMIDAEQHNVDTRNRILPQTIVIDKNEKDTVTVIRFINRHRMNSWNLEAENKTNNFVAIKDKGLMQSTDKNPVVYQSWEIKGLKSGTTALKFKEIYQSKTITETTIQLSVIE